MPVSLFFDPGLALAFVLVLTRVAACFVFLPIPGVRGAVEPVRPALAIAFTCALYPAWPRVTALPGLGQTAAWMLAEAAFGVAAGLLVACLAEAFVLAGQIIGLQAGYSYASTVDPNTEADSSVLPLFTQTAANLLFFVCGLDRAVLRIFARSLEALPPGAWRPTGQAAQLLAAAGAAMFELGLRLALPVAALLLITDLSLALLGRLNAQLQLLSLAFPLKMLAALLVFAALAPVFVRLYAGAAARTLAGLAKLAGV